MCPMWDDLVSRSADPGVPQHGGEPCSTSSRYSRALEGIHYWTFVPACKTYDECLLCVSPPFVAWTYVRASDRLERIFRDATASSRGAVRWDFQTMEPMGRRWVLMPAQLREYSDYYIDINVASRKLERKDPKFGPCAHRELRRLLDYIRELASQKRGRSECDSVSVAPSA